MHISLKLTIHIYTKKNGKKPFTYTWKQIDLKPWGGMITGTNVSHIQTHTSTPNIHYNENENSNTLIRDCHNQAFSSFVAPNSIHFNDDPIAFISLSLSTNWIFYGSEIVSSSVQVTNESIPVNDCQYYGVSVYYKVMLPLELIASILMQLKSDSDQVFLRWDEKNRTLNIL